MLDHEEFVEQAHFFRTLLERLGQDTPIQELMLQVKHEILATTKLPYAIDFLVAELKHHGIMAQGMSRLSHYFTPFQTFIVEESEKERGRFEFRMALRILCRDAEYRSQSDNRQGFFFYQFESICRNRLNYDRGLKAMSDDPSYDADWKAWLLLVRKQLGILDLADLIYGRSQDFDDYRKRKLGPDTPPAAPVLFGVKEGRIAHAHRHKDPLLLFAAMQRHLGYPQVPRPEPIDTISQLIPQLQRRLERLEARIKLLEDEQKQDIDITKFYSSSQGPRVDLSFDDLPVDERFQ